MPGLSVSDVVNVDINMSPMAVPLRNFGTLCIAGPSTAIDVGERIREYTTIDGIAEDFGTSSPEYEAGVLFFSQAPRPAICYVGRFAQNPTSAVLHGGIITPLEQIALLNQMKLVTNGTMKITIDGTVRTVQATTAHLNGGIFSDVAADALVITLTAITTGAFAITIDGAVHEVGPIDFSGIAGSDTATKLGAAGNLISTALGANGTATYDTLNQNFVIRSKTTGTGSTITFATAPATGTDISATLQLTSLTGAQAPVPGTTGMDFTSVTNLNGAATIINNALQGASCRFDGSQFHIQTLSNGPTSSISYASSAGIGQDVSTPLKLTQASGAYPPVDGIEAETPLECAVALRAHPQWYGLMFAVDDEITVDDHIAVAEYIEACDPVSIYGFTTNDTGALAFQITTDLFSQCKALGYTRTFGQFSSNNPNAVASIFGRAFTVDFEANNTVLTLKFKQEPGVLPEILTQTQAAALKFKRANVFVTYSNDASIIQEGVMCSGMFFDERHNVDWLANRIQTDVFNVLYQSPTKIPQTNQGVHIIVAVVEASLQQAVVNGMVAPGQWNAPGFGQINYGQMLTKGYYVWAPLVETQPQSIREQRIAPTIQCAIKLAGAVHFANVIVNVNR